MKNTISTHSGKRFDLRNPRPCDVEIEDIAIALARIARFTGHTKDFLSVGQHVVNVARILNEWGEPIEVQLYGLLHDAPEYVLNDVVSPLKRMLPQYRAFERRVMKAILKGLKLHKRLCLTKEQLKTVKLADDCCFLAERRDQVNWGQGPRRPFTVSKGAVAWDKPIVGMEWPTAYQQFLAYFDKLTDAL